MDNNLDRLMARTWQERMSRRRFLRMSGMGMGAVALGPLLAACGRGGGQPAGSQAAVQTLAAPANKVNLTFWNPFTGPDGPVMKEMVDRFNSETPNVQVAVTTQAEYDPKIDTAATANRLPHILIARMGGALARYAANGFIQPVGDLVDLLGLSADDFTEAVWTGAQWKGEQYAIPLDTHPLTFYWSKSAFTEAGLDPETPPADEQTFRDALSALNEAGYTGPVWSNHAFSAGLFWASLYYQGGGTWINENFEATYNDEAGVQAAEFMASLVQDGLHPESVEVDAELPALEQGDSGMIVAGPWQLSRFVGSLGDDLGAGPIPKVFGEGVWGGSHTFAVTADVTGDEKQGAYYFINWITSNAVDWAGAGQVPVRTEVREDPAFAEVAHIPTIAEQVADVRYFPSVPGSDDMLFGAGGANEAVVAVLVGDEEAEPALTESAERYTRLMQDAQEEYEL